MVTFAEPKGASVPAELLDGLRRGFTPSELDCLQEGSGRTRAVTGRTTPKAMWVVGPSASGKSSAAGQLVAACMDNEASVVIDGALVREYHGGWRAVRDDGLGRSPPAIHKEAWDIFKASKVSENVKKQLHDEAVHERQNIVIPDCVKCLRKCVDKLAKQRRNRYEVRIVAIFAPVEATRARGEVRSLKEGKTFSVRGYQDSVQNCVSLVRSELESFPGGEHMRFIDNSGLQAREICAEEYLSLCEEELASCSSDSGLLVPSSSLLSCTASSLPESAMSPAGSPVSDALARAGSFGERTGGSKCVDCGSPRPAACGEATSDASLSLGYADDEDVDNDLAALRPSPTFAAALCAPDPPKIPVSAVSSGSLD
eukprot:Rhum_TRINITY_DN14851_c16_g1::Rhum_TRINITY_DN14851_c16_g1_i1::g.123071::m.123071